MKDIEDLWKVNVMGPWILTKHAWKYLSMSNSARIIVLVSMSGKRSKGNLCGYSMSKFALMSLCQTMRNEGWENGIRVTAICPGWVNTDMAKEIKHYPKKDMSQANDIASICSNLLTLPNSSIPFEIALNCQLETNIYKISLIFLNRISSFLKCIQHSQNCLTKILMKVVSIKTSYCFTY